MNPKPFESLNHFTVPVAMSFIPTVARGYPSFAAGTIIKEGIDWHWSRFGRRGSAFTALYPAARTLAHARGARPHGLLPRAFAPALVGVRRALGSARRGRFEEQAHRLREQPERGHPPPPPPTTQV